MLAVDSCLTRQPVGRTTGLAQQRAVPVSTLCLVLNYDVRVRWRMLMGSSVL